MNSTYCQPFQSSPFVVNDYECPCAHSSANKTIMAANVEFYNQALESVYLTYKAQNFPTFGVAYQPLAVDILSFPIEVISNIGMYCFHTSVLTLIASSNNLFFHRLFSSGAYGTPMVGKNDLVKFRLLCTLMVWKLH
jgi:hypothetical protein